MALDAAVQIEVRTGGNDDNGGGFKEGASGTDFTLQDSADLSLTDLATSGIGVTTVTSAAGGFLSTHIGNLIQIRSGTNVVADFYEILTRVDTNTITVDRAPDDGVGGISGGSGDIGGALASLGHAHKALLTDGMRLWQKTGTYTMTTSTPGKAGPIVTGADSIDWQIRGYNTTRGDLNLQPDDTNKPINSAGAITNITLLTVGNTSNPCKLVQAIVLDGNAGANNIGIVPGSRCAFVGVHVRKCPDTGFSASTFVYYACEADDCGIGFGATDNIYGCVAHDCSGDGFIGASDAYYSGCIAYNNGGDGIVVGTRGKINNCISHGNTGEGFKGSTSAISINCIATDNGAFGFNNFRQVLHCADRNNTSGFTNLVTFEDDTVTLTADPYVDEASNDFRLNDDAGGGALLKAIAIIFPGQVQVRDIGGFGHSDPAAGGGLLTHPSMSGGARG